MEAWKAALLNCMRYFSPQIENLGQAREPTFIKSLFSELCPDWEGSFEWMDLLDFIRTEYPKFIICDNNEDVVTLSLLLLHCMVWKPCPQLQKHASLMDEQDQKIIMEFLNAMMKYKHRITYDIIKEDLLLKDTAKSPETPRQSTSCTSTPLKDFLNSPAASRARWDVRSEVAILRDQLCEERNEKEALLKEIDHLKQIQKNLDGKLTESRMEISFLNEELSFTQKKIEESVARESQCGEKVSAKQAEIEELAKVLVNLEEEMAALKTDLSKKETKIAAFEKDEEKLRSLVQRNNEEIESLRLKADEYWGEKNIVMERCALLQRKLEEVDCSSPARKWSGKRSEGDTLAAEMVQCELMEKTTQVSEMEKALAEMREEVDRVEQALANAQALNSEQAHKFTELEKKHADLGTDFKDTVMRFATELQTAHNQKEKLRLSFEVEKNELTARVNELSKLIQEKECTLRIEQSQFELEKIGLEKRLAEEIDLRKATIAKKKEEIAQRDAEILTMQQVIASKTAHIAKVEQEIIAKETQLVEKNEDIATKEACIAKMGEEITSKDTHIAKVKGEIAMKDSALRQKGQEIISKDAHISEMEKQITSKDTHIANMEGEVAVKDAMLQEKEKEIATKDSYIAKVEENIATKDAMLREKEKELATKDSHIAIVEKDVATKDAVLREKEEEIATKDSHIARIENEITSKDTHVAKLEGVIALKDSAIVEKHQEIVSKDAIIAEMRGEISANNIHVVKLQEDIAMKCAKLLEIEGMIGAKDALITELKEKNSTKNAHIAKVEEEIAHFVKIEKELSVKNALVQEKEKEIVTKDAEIAIKNNKILSMEKEIEGKGAKLEKKEEEISLKDTMIMERKAEIVEKNITIEEKNKIISEKADIIEGKNSIISDKDRIIAEKNSIILVKDRIIEEKDGDAAEKARLLAEKDETISSLQKALEETKIEIEESIVAQSALFVKNNDILKLKTSLEVQFEQLKNEMEEINVVLPSAISGNDVSSVTERVRQLCAERKRSQEALSLSSSQVEACKVELKQCEAEKLALETTNKDLTAAIEEMKQLYDEQLEGLKNVVSEKDSVINQHSKEKKELLETLEEFKKSLEAANVARRAIESELVESRQKIQELKEDKLSCQEKLEKHSKKQKKFSDLQGSFDSVIQEQETEVQNHLTRLRTWLDRVTSSCDSLTRSLPGSCTAVCEVNATKRDIEQMLRSVDEKYINCLNSTIRCSGDMLKLMVPCERGAGDTTKIEAEDIEELQAGLGAVRNLMTELVGDVRDVISRCKFLVDRCEFFMNEQDRQVQKMKISLTKESPDGASKAVLEDASCAADPAQVDSEVEKKYKTLQAAYADLQVNYKNLEAKLSGIQSHDNIQLLHEHYAAKLETLKVKMDQICTAEINKMKEERDRSEKETIARYEKRVAEFRSHVQSQASQLWELNEKLIQLEQEKKALQDKLLKLFDGDKSQTGTMAQNRGHSLSVDWLDRIGQDDVPLIRSRPDRQSLCERKKVEPPAKPKRTVLASSMGRIEEVTPNPAPARTASSGNAVMAPASMGVAFPEEDEDGELFNNTYLADMKSGRTRLNEFQHRNSMCPPHLKSSYPGETQFHDPKLFNEDEIKVSNDSRRLTKDRSQKRRSVWPRLTLSQQARSLVRLWKALSYLRFCQCRTGPRSDPQPRIRTSIPESQRRQRYRQLPQPSTLTTISPVQRSADSSQTASPRESYSTAYPITCQGGDCGAQVKTSSPRRRKYGTLDRESTPTTSFKRRTKFVVNRKKTSGPPSRRESYVKIEVGEVPRKKRPDWVTYIPSMTRQTSYKRPGPPTPSKNGRRLSLQSKEEAKQTTPRGVLLEPNRQSSGSLMSILRTGKTTPSRLRALFTSSKVGAVQGASAPPANHNTDENDAPLTPTSKRMSIFKKRFGPREPPPNSSFSTYR